jgi:hypothetical protein
MPRCPKGHEQRLGLKCATCGLDLSYRAAVDEMGKLPEVSPNYGKVSVITAGFPKLSVKADYVGAVSAGQSALQTPTSFQVASIRGGSWLEYNKEHLDELRRWMKLVGVEKSTDRFVVVDATDPMSVLTLTALPQLGHTAVIAVVADEGSTPVEQNTSYVALSLALKKGIPVIALNQTFEGEMIYFTEDKGFATGGDAVSRLLDSLLGAADDLMDLLERDMKLGIKTHCLSAVVAGSKGVYGTATNAFMAQSYDLSMRAEPDQYQTVHCMAFAEGDSRGEFEKSFGVFRNRKFKGALSAEFRFHETDSPLYDLVTIYGMGADTSLQGMAAGYQAIVQNMPQLSAEGASR